MGDPAQHLVEVELVGDRLVDPGEVLGPLSRLTLVAQQPVALLQLGDPFVDVHGKALRADDVVAVEHDVGTALQPVDAAVGVHAAVVEAGRPALLDHLPHARLDHRSVARVEPRHPRLIGALERAWDQAEQRLEVAVPAHGVVVAVPVPGPDARHVHRVDDPRRLIEGRADTAQLVLTVGAQPRQPHRRGGADGDRDHGQEVAVGEEDVVDRPEGDGDHEGQRTDSEGRARRRQACGDQRADDQHRDDRQRRGDGVDHGDHDDHRDARPHAEGGRFDQAPCTPHRPHCRSHARGRPLRRHGRHPDLPERQVTWAQRRRAPRDRQVSSPRQRSSRRGRRTGEPPCHAGAGR